MSRPNIRLDRFLTTAVFHPLRRVFGEGGVRVPVLMYHRICEDPEAGVSPYYKVNTSPLVFRQHLRYLAEKGYRTVDLTEVSGLLTRGEPLVPKTVVITFDDGFRDFYTEAWPALREQHFTATVFLPTAYIHEKRRSFKGAECLTWEEVRELRKAGIEFGSHTVSHPELRRLSLLEVERELRDSKDQMEQQLSEQVTAFAYPYAFPQDIPEFARALHGLLVQAGYTCCATTEIGRVKAGDDPFRLKRLPANGLDDPLFFKAKLDGGYDWLAGPQALVKYIGKGAQGAHAPTSAKVDREAVQFS
jgi:peptidoglycan/xylan/chitin deacetylase (PgdA/CDA1 family)